MDRVPSRNAVTGGLFQGPVLQAETIHASFRLAGAAPAALAELPPEVVAFTGRDRELAELSGLLAPGAGEHTVVVTVVAGLAGVGKTALAVQAGHAARRQGWFGGGVLYIDLHGYDEQPVAAAQAADSLLRALGVAAEHIPAGLDGRSGLYRSVLAQIAEPVLVIADNASCEAQVRPLLPGAGPHKVLVTSRHTLAGLGARLIDITALGSDAAATLLDAALRTARPADDRISSDPEAAQLLAQAYGRLPLALQITAARLTADPVLSAAEAARELAASAGRLDHLRYDDGSQAGAPSVVAAFELSYRRLDERAARLFRLLPVNPGPDVSTGAAAVLADLPPGETRRILGSLARAHLAEAAPGTGGRWRMHDLVRLYAQRIADIHADADGRDQVRYRLLDYYLTMTDAADAHLRASAASTLPERFASRDQALAWLDAERASLVAAVGLGVATGRDRFVVYLPESLTEYLTWRRRFDDLLTVTSAQVTAARQLGDWMHERVALNNMGIALRELGQLDQAIAAHQELSAICRQDGDQRGAGAALNNLGFDLCRLGRFDQAITAHQDAAAILLQTADRRSVGFALNGLGAALCALRRFSEAVTAHQDAAEIFRQDGDQRGMGMALNLLGVALREARRYDQAVEGQRDQTAILRQIQSGQSTTLGNLGALPTAQRFEQAIPVLEAASAIFHQVGDRHNEAMALGDLGIALGRMGRFGEAITCHQESLSIWRQVGDRHHEGIAVHDLGVDLWEVGRRGEAIAAIREAAGIFSQTGDQDLGRLAQQNLTDSMAEHDS